MLKAAPAMNRNEIDRRRNTPLANPAVRAIGGGVLVSGTAWLGLKLIGYAAVLITAVSWLALPLAIGAGVFYGVREYRLRTGR